MATLFGWFPTPPWPKVLATYCMPPCAARAEALRLRIIQWSPRWDAWVFPDSPLRRVSAIAAAAQVARGIENHHGESYRYYPHEGFCPWCGKIMPGPAAEDDRGEGWE